MLASLLGWFSGQTVSPSDMAALQTAIDLSEQLLMAALAPLDYGTAPLSAWPLRGFYPSASGSDNIITVVGPGAISVGMCVDSIGNRQLVRMLGSGTINLAGITVATSRYVTVVYRRYLAGTNPRTDDQNQTNNYNLADGTAAIPPTPPYGPALTYGGLDGGDTVSGGLVYVLGADSGSPSRPAIPWGTVPVCDILLAPSYGSFINAQLDLSRCRPAWAKHQSPGLSTPNFASGSLQHAIASLMEKTFDACRVAPNEPNDAFVLVRGGRFNADGVAWDVLGGPNVPDGATKQASTGTNSPGIGSSGGAALAAMTVPASGNDKKYLIYVDPATGYVQQAVGASAATGTAVAPSHLGRIPLAEITVAGVGGGGGNASIYSSMIRDVRPFARATKYNPNRSTTTPVNTTVTITLPFSYVIGAKQLMVFKNGDLLTLGGGATQYVEVDPGTGIGTQITLGTACNGTDVIDVLCGLVADVNPVQPHAVTHAAGGADPIDYSPMNATIAGRVCAYTTGNTSITVEPFGLILNGKMYATPTAGFTLTTATTPSSGTIYYAYAYISGGAVAIETVTTVPDPNTGRRSKTGDASRVYLFPITTQNSGVFKAFRRLGRATTFINDLNAYVLAAGNNALDGSVATISASSSPSTQSVSLSMYVPPWVLVARISSMIYTSTGTLSAFLLKAIGLGAQANLDIQAASVTSSLAATRYPQASPTLNGSQQFTYATTAGTGGGLVSGAVFVDGFED